MLGIEIIVGLNSGLNWSAADPQIPLGMKRKLRKRSRIVAYLNRLSDPSGVRLLVVSLDQRYSYCPCGNLVRKGRIRDKRSR